MLAKGDEECQRILCYFPYLYSSGATLIRSVCKVRTQDPENFDEEVKSLLTAWRIKGLDRR